MLDPLLEQGVVRLERPRHERGEAAELVLELADHVEVLEQIVGLLDVAVHHRRRGFEPAAMGLAMHLEPRVGAALLRLDPTAYALGQDLGPAPGQGPLARIPQPIEDVADRELLYLRDGADL